VLTEERVITQRVPEEAEPVDPAMNCFALVRVTQLRGAKLNSTRLLAGQAEPSHTLLNSGVWVIRILHVWGDVLSCPQSEGFLVMKLSAGIKPFAWGAVSGAILWWIVLAFGFGWMSSGTAQKQAARLSGDAVIAALAPVCAEKFMAHPNAAVKKAALAKASSWDRRDVFEKQWVTRPGDQSPDMNLVTACSELVLRSS